MRRLLVLCMLILICGCIAEKVRQERDPSSVVDACKINDESQLNYSALKKRLQNSKCKMKTVEDVLGVLPVSFRSRYSLMYQSRSLQGPHIPDFLNPRVIMFGPSEIANKFYGVFQPVQFAMTFNGNPFDTGYDSLEMFDVHLDAKNPDDIFQFYEITFPKNATELSWDETQTKIRFHERPINCRGCHGSPSHPIFDGYPFWLGAFGSHDGGEIDQTELEEFFQFSKRAASHGRYQLLANLDHFLHPAGRQKYFSISGIGPNLALNNGLAQANDVRVAREIVQSPDYEPYKYAYLGAWGKCPNLSDFLPEPIRLIHEKNIFDQLGRDRFKTDEQIDAEQSKIHENTYDVQNYIDQRFPTQLVRRLRLNTERLQVHFRRNETAIWVRYIFEGRKMNIENWFMDLVQPSYSIYNGGQSEVDLVNALVKEDPSLAQWAHRLQNLPIPSNPDNLKVNREYWDRTCGELATVSQRELSSLPTLRVTLPAPSHGPSRIDFNNYPLTFVNTCANCHTEGPGPRIEFEQPAVFASRLQREPKLAKEISTAISGESYPVMPPNRRLTEDETNSILNYLSKY